MPGRGKAEAHKEADSGGLLRRVYRDWLLTRGVQHRDGPLDPSGAEQTKEDSTCHESIGDKRSLEKSGMIARVETPTEWISNLTAVWKADKTQVRVCLDPRDLNKAIRRNHFKMPTLDDVLPELTGAKVFSILDAKDGFLQIGCKGWISPDSSE